MPRNTKCSPLDIMEAIEKFKADNGYSPTYRDLEPLLGINKSTIHFRIDALAGKGLVEKTPRICRGLAVTEAGLSMLRKEGRLSWR